MGNSLKNRKMKLKSRIQEFEAQRDKQGYKKPGSMNSHKQAAGGSPTSGKGRRR